jgi:hypothetical protein
MKVPMLVSAILIGLSSSADARDVLLLCHLDGPQSWPGFNIRVDLENFAVTRYDPGRFSRHEATITFDYIEYTEGMFLTRINRNSGDLVSSSYTGTIVRGSCEKTDDHVRWEENICCSLIPVEPKSDR